MSSPIRPVSTYRARMTERRSSPICATTRTSTSVNCTVRSCCSTMRSQRNCPAALSADQRYIRARQLVRWAYQYIVLNDYLPTVCDPAVVSDVTANGLRYYAPDNDLLFMPLEFSVAAFRFGHSMIRPQYQLNAATPPLSLMQLLNVGGLLDGGVPPKVAGANIIAWHNFAQIGSQPAPQMARKIDPLISAGPRKPPGLPAGLEDSGGRSVAAPGAAESAARLLAFDSHGPGCRRRDADGAANACRPAGSV